ncbi:MAG: alcohol dehydrogenase [Verminephrobacter sp.]|nr:alcohol dehydrogenase [Verminephrobacter sp.]
MAWRRVVLMSIAATLAALVVAALVALNLRGEAPLPATTEEVPATAAQVARGAYLARVGSCAGCHTARGGAAYAGGRGIETPFGKVFAGNLTPDVATGLGAWSSADFWRALHHGRSRDGRLLYPAFPYPNYTQVTREDSDALYAYLRSLPAVAQPRTPHALRFPFSTQAALAVWRALYFRPGQPPEDLSRSAEWNRGAYLVQGLGHCAACHTPRNALGAERKAQALGGGTVAGQGWYAPALDMPAEAGVAQWPLQDVVALLQTGVAPQGSVTGPMAEVVFRSTQHLTPTDARAIAVYLQALPQRSAPVVVAEPPAAAALARGAKVYEQHCAQCHGDQGQGVPGAIAALAGNRAVLQADTTNLLREVLQGGYLPATAGNPRPHGMPPFRQVLGDEDVAAVLSFVRNAWGNQAPGVGTIDAYRAREARNP